MSSVVSQIETQTAPRMIIYEHPLQERIRTFLRLESLFLAAETHTEEASVWTSRAAMSGLQGMLAIFSRSDLKTEIIKELKRHIQTLSTMQGSPGVDDSRLQTILDQLQILNEQVYRQEGQLGQSLRNNDFLKSVGQRASIPGGDCVFDIPQYHRWLQLTSKHRHGDLTRWLSELRPVRDAIILVLELVRSSSHPVNIIARHGLYQENLDIHAPSQLLRVGISSDLPCYPEISGSKHRVSIRFMTSDDGYGKSTSLDDDVPFQMTTCVI